MPDADEVTPYRVEIADAELRDLRERAAFEQPGLFVDEVRACFRLVR